MQQKAGLQQLLDMDSKKTNKSDSEMMLKTIHLMYQHLHMTTVLLCESIQLLKDPQLAKV